MNKSELVKKVAAQQAHLEEPDVRLAIDDILEQMALALAQGGRIEIREFGSFSVHELQPRMGRNPKTGTPVTLGHRYIPHFKPGKQLRERANRGYKPSGE